MLELEDGTIIRASIPFGTDNLSDTISQEALNSALRRYIDERSQRA